MCTCEFWQVAFAGAYAKWRCFLLQQNNFNAANVWWRDESLPQIAVFNAHFAKLKHLKLDLETEKSLRIIEVCWGFLLEEKKMNEIVSSTETYGTHHGDYQLTVANQSDKPLHLSSLKSNKDQ